MAEAGTPQPDKVVPLEKRTRTRSRTSGGASRTRRARSTSQATRADTEPGIIQAPEIVKSELDTITEGLATLYGTLGTFVMFGDEYDGFTIISNAENMAKSVVAACRPYPQAWKILRMVVQGNVWSVLVLAHLGPTVAIMANHGMINKSVAAAFRQAPIPEKQQQQTTNQEAPGPYTYPGSEIDMSQMSAQEQQDLQAYIAAMAVQMGQQTAQQEAAMYAPPPVDWGDAGQNGAVGMDSVGGLGDRDVAAVRASFSAEQINRIREESIRKTLEQTQTGQMNGL
jgi:hypothetical protein